MASWIPGGNRQPLNMIEGPEYPDIKQHGLRFTWSRKHWKVDAGDALMNSSMYPQFVEGAVLYESRDRNISQYGQSSHRDYVNEVVRLPLISPYDMLPYSRTPRRPVFPYVNPGLSHNLQVTQDNMFNGQFGYITDRVTYTSRAPLKSMEASE